MTLCPIGEKIRKAIDKHFADTQSSGFRHHLGASVIGHPCVRHVWYHFRWVYSQTHSGRLLRLFNRGHDEEPRVVAWLTSIGAIVDTGARGKQHRVSWGSDHCGGSLDGKVSNLDRFGLAGEGLLEIKTHNAASYNTLTSKGLVQSKPQHYAQMQTYMYLTGLRWGLYTAVNKNTDDLHIEVVYAKPEIGEAYVDRGTAVIAASEAPPRINDSESWYLCRMCNYRAVCHRGVEPDQNCRSCIFARPIEDGQWYCGNYHQPIPKDFLPHGCSRWSPVA